VQTLPTLKNQPLKVHESILIFSKQPIQKFNPILELRTETSLKRCPIGKSLTFRPSKKENPEYYNTGLPPRAHSLRDNGLKHPTSIRVVASRQKGVYQYQHPTKKPVALCRYLIETYTNAGDLVLDNCLGSGTTAVACVETGRNFIGIEMGDYFDTHCVPRLKESIQQQSQKLF
jgi:site-specific DNA-methyltransferase (adenine-specific)